ncbi:hypothetical protein CCACVL1_19871 [Corchorus capsularis]|uniref:Uncharacterized protein n=1 Tax=Corchorus capsularis TaxID=210143 RepID=A0A1R3HEA2_COCAP|nr:hypothetical protein CCACVL1_19871 [Corchorus capsularis]
MKFMKLGSKPDTFHSDGNDVSSTVLQPWCVSAQTVGSTGGTLTIVDERTRKKCQVPVSSEGIVKAADFKKDLHKIHISIRVKDHSAKYLAYHMIDEKNLQKPTVEFLLKGVAVIMVRVRMIVVVLHMTLLTMTIPRTSIDIRIFVVFWCHQFVVAAKEESKNDIDVIGDPDIGITSLPSNDAKLITSTVSLPRDIDVKIKYEMRREVTNVEDDNSDSRNEENQSSTDEDYRSEGENEGESRSGRDHGGSENESDGASNDNSDDDHPRVVGIRVSFTKKNKKSERE